MFLLKWPVDINAAPHSSELKSNPDQRQRLWFSVSMTTEKRVGEFRYTAAYSFRISSPSSIKARWSVVFGPPGKQALVVRAHLN